MVHRMAILAAKPMMSRRTPRMITVCADLVESCGAFRVAPTRSRREQRDRQGVESEAPTEAFQTPVAPLPDTQLACLPVSLTRHQVRR